MLTTIHSTIFRESFFCPVCEDDTMVKIQHDLSPCQHLPYVYFDDVDEFDAYTPELEKIVEQVVEETGLTPPLLQQVKNGSISGREATRLAESSMHPVEHLIELHNRSGALHFGIETQGGGR